ncbi:RimK/LysX family protein [Aliifodinibius salicampi]|uniref:RimK/LysX family protein n=1 Tax=Fodinibius salicampi TaxID=1920655 RepID=A0ABT3PVK5_9BACT|nr:RimK/LysX family protein [Fodinibius salicampi]MCW9711894.1 RimK/LysX family protein [Fodinibius salicampi]
MNRLQEKKLKIIGRLERINFPEWDLFDIDAKIDTGAYTSSLHCHHIEPFSKEGRSYVRFNLLDPSHETYNEKLFELPVHATKNIKSSNGTTEQRYIIKTAIRLLDKEFKAELSLADRSEMRYPVLLGRKFINKRFVVDVSKKYLSDNN